MRRGLVGDNLQTWRTPHELVGALKAEFHFDSDPCPPTVLGLPDTWGKSVFLNPPYAAIEPWLRQAVDASHRGSTVVALLPVRTDTAWFHDLVLAEGAEIRWIRGRLSFSGHAGAGRPTFASMVVIWRAQRGDAA